MNNVFAVKNVIARRVSTKKTRSLPHSATVRGISVLETSILLAALIPLVTFGAAICDYLIKSNTVRAICDKYASDALIKPLVIDGSGQIGIDLPRIRAEMSRLVAAADAELGQAFQGSLEPSEYLIEADFVSLRFDARSGRFTGVQNFFESKKSAGFFSPKDSHAMQRAIDALAINATDAIPLPSFGALGSKYLQNRIVLGLRIVYSLDKTRTGRLLKSLGSLNEIAAQGLKTVMLRGEVQ